MVFTMKVFKTIFVIFISILIFTTIFFIISKNNNKITITYWAIMDDNRFHNEVLPKFNNKHPEIEIKYSSYKVDELRENFISSSKMGNPPDILYSASDNIGIYKKYIQKINNITDEAWINTYDEKVLSLSKYENENYMFPVLYGFQLMLFYNPKLVKKAPQSFEELIKICKTLRKKNKVKHGLVFSMCEPYFVVPFLGAFNGTIFSKLKNNSIPVLNTKAMKDVFIFLKRLQNQKVVPRYLCYFDAEEVFKNGDAAFMINGPWCIRELVNDKTNFKLAVIPTINNSYPTPYKMSWGYVISSNVKDKKKKEAIEKFIKHSTSEKEQRIYSSFLYMLPTNKNLLKSDYILNNWIFSKQLEQLEKCIPLPGFKQMRIVWDEMKKIQIDLFANRITSQEAPALIQKNIYKKLQDLRDFK